MNQIITTNADHHIPWNKGKLIGQKSPLKLKEIWAIRIVCNWQTEHGNWLYSIWPSTASCAAAIWLSCACVMSPRVTEFQRGP